MGRLIIYCDVTWENDVNELGDIGLRFFSQSRVSIIVNPDALLAGEAKARAFLKIKMKTELLSLGRGYGQVYSIILTHHPHLAEGEGFEEVWLLS